MLSLPPMQDQAAVSATSPVHYKPLPDDFIGALEEILVTYIHDNDLNIKLAASLCNLSKRTLQRKLEEMGTRYSELLDHARFRVASRLLHNPDVNVTNIALQLGYSDVSHFARSFRRIAGVNPRVYRRQFSSETGSS